MGARNGARRSSPAPSKAASSISPTTASPDSGHGPARKAATSRLISRSKGTTCSSRRPGIKRSSSMTHEEGMVRASRLNALERLLLSQPKRAWRTKEIADHFGVSVDTASDDLGELSSRGRVTLTTEGKGPATRWVLAEGIKLPTLDPLHLDYVQGAALYAAARLLSQQQDERNDAVRLAL